MVYDCIIIGMGPAGITAAIYAKRSGLNTLIIEKGAPGGQLNFTDIVDNYPGFQEIFGPDLALKMFEHLSKFEIPAKNQEVLSIIDGDIKKVITNKEEFQTKAIIITTGRSAKKLGLELEEELSGHGVSYCAICDGPLYKGKEVAIIGAGNSAMEDAEYLGNMCKKVTVINALNFVPAEKYLQKQLDDNYNVFFKNNSKVTSLKQTDGKLSSIIINEEEEINVEGLFICIGYAPSTKFARDLDLTNEMGYIIVNDKQETKLPGIFAAGDITKKEVYQIVTAEAEGAKAAVNLFNYISSL